jgi:hypothetical protein
VPTGWIVTDVGSVKGQCREIWRDTWQSLDASESATSSKPGAATRPSVAGLLRPQVRLTPEQPIPKCTNAGG